MSIASLLLRNCLLGSVVLIACNDPRESVLPTVGPITESVYASGVVKAHEQYTVYPQVNGLLVMAYVTEGDTVHTGDPLFLIDDRATSLSSRNAELNVALLEKNASANSPVLAQLQANMTKARQVLENDSALLLKQQRLWEQRIGSENDLEQRRLAFVTAQSSYAAAVEAYTEARSRLRSDLQVARNNLAINRAAEDDRTVRSLVNGLVYDVQVEKGELATTQRPLAILGSATDFYLELQVDEYDIVKIAVGQRVLVTMDSYKGDVLEAVITKIDPIMDERSRTFTVEAAFTQPPARLYPNLTAETNIIIRTRTEALTIPADYLIEDRYVLVDDMQKREVGVGLRDLQRVEITNGLDSSTTVYRP